MRCRPRACVQEVCGFTFCEELFLCQVPRLKASNTPRSLPERAALPTVYSYTAGVAPPASACEEASVRPYPSILGWLWAGFSPYRAHYVCRKEAAAQVRHTPQLAAPSPLLRPSLWLCCGTHLPPQRLFALCSGHSEI